VKEMNKKLILFDVDGTVYDNNHKHIPASTITALKALKSKGHELVIATGRAYFMLYSIEEIKPLIDHYILINGQHILSGEDTIYEDTVDKVSMNNLIKSMEDIGVTYGFESAYHEAVSEINDEVKSSFVKLNLNLPPENKNFHKQQKVYQMWCFCDEGKVEILRKQNSDFDFVRWVTVGYDIIKKGQSKGKGINVLANYLGFKNEDIIAFGDGDNDIEMVQGVGLGIAMGNGTERIKKVADYITDDIDKDGIYNALKHFKLL
jgi:Cof subfamily protein (haloacid dehalogenase superfamily)